KRLVRETFGQHQNGVVGLQMVIVARKGLGDVENPDTFQHFGKLWNRLARIRPIPEEKSEPAGVDSPDA
ncbi:ribonuclease P protein component, partial [Pseudomonas syringae]